MGFKDNINFGTKGHLTIRVKNTDRLIDIDNLVVKNSSHICALALSQKITSNYIKMCSWDHPEELVPPSNLDMTDLAALLAPHSEHIHHKTLITHIENYSFKTLRLISFKFSVDMRRRAVQRTGIIGKNVREFGLYFNDILFARVALDQDFIIEDWMEIEGEWSIIITGCYGGFSSYILNQYDMISVWGFNRLISSLSTNEKLLEDYIGNNHLNSLINPPMLLNKLKDYIINCDTRVDLPYDLTRVCAIDRDAIPIMYQENEIYNLPFLRNNEQKDLELSPDFTLYTWFYFSDFEDLNEQSILLSKWNEQDIIKRSWRLYIEKEEDTGPELFSVNFEIVVDNSLLELKIPMKQITQESWHLINVKSYKQNDENIFAIFLDGVRLGEVKTTSDNFNTSDSSFFIGAQQLGASNSPDTDTVFRGLIDEAGYSKYAFSDTAIIAQWSNGEGDFYYR